MRFFVIAIGVVLLFGALALFYFSMLSSVDDKEELQGERRTSATSWRTAMLYVGSLLMLVFSLGMFGVPIVERASLTAVLVFCGVAAIVFVAARRVFLSTVRYTETLPRLYE